MNPEHGPRQERNGKVSVQGAAARPGVERDESEKQLNRHGPNGTRLKPMIASPT